MSVVDLTNTVSQTFRIFFAYIDIMALSMGLKFQILPTPAANAILMMICIASGFQNRPSPETTRVPPSTAKLRAETLIPKFISSGPGPLNLFSCAGDLQNKSGTCSSASGIILHFHDMEIVQNHCKIDRIQTFWDFQHLGVSFASPSVVIIDWY